MKKRTYKFIDVLVFTVIACFIEAINIFVLKYIFKGQLFSLSVSIPIALIVLMRWKAWAIIPAGLSGVVYCACNGGSAAQYLIYGVGNIAVLVCLLWFKFLGQNRVREKFYWTMLYALSGFVIVNLFRAIFAMIEVHNFGSALVGFMGIDALNLAIGLAIMLIARRQSGLMENQDEYLIKIQKELREQEGMYGG